MLAQKLIDRLEGVKQTGEGHWRARCPSHGSKGQTLSVTEKGDRVLVKCFAECPVDHVLGSVGLELEDLFPPRDPNDRNGIYTGANKNYLPRIPAKDVLDCLSDEVDVATHYIDKAAKGEKLFREDVERFQTCRNRIKAARKYIDA